MAHLRPRGGGEYCFFLLQLAFVERNGDPFLPFPAINRHEIVTGKFGVRGFFDVCGFSFFERKNFFSTNNHEFSLISDFSKALKKFIIFTRFN